MSNTEKRIARIERAQQAYKGIGEPMIREDHYAIDIMRALNWYRANEENKTITKYGLEFLKKNNKTQYVKFFNEAADWETNQVAILMRLAFRNQYLDSTHLKLIDTRLEEIKDKYTKLQEQVKVEEKPVVPVISVQDRVLESAKTFAAEIDAEIDNFISNKTSDFSTKTFLLKNNISGQVAKKISEFYIELNNELQEAILGEDEQLVEGYSHFTKAQLKKFQLFVQSIIADCDQQIVRAKSARAPRAKKEKAPGLLVSKMKYMFEFPELNLKSINPTEIIKADEVWVYNTKTRKMIVYRGENGPVLSVRGTTILNYDTITSEAKTLRKPEDFFKTQIGKRPLNAAFKTINSKPATPNGRINHDTIIVAAFK
ncbi:MAG: hypothetical protein EBU90_13500 [Proteobacteria bacterium]|nr:hypothetical protein [Pseudomonadota bacterium]